VKELSDVPSEMILQALEDLESVEKDPAYKVDMLEWHLPATTMRPHCEVCFAGAVMARRFDVQPNRYAEPQDFLPAARDKFRALNYFRTGNIVSALRYLHREHPQSLPIIVRVPAYDPLVPAFKDKMREIASTLAAAGL
jgi:hypothetical protein